MYILYIYAAIIIAWAATAPRSLLRTRPEASCILIIDGLVFPMHLPGWERECRDRDYANTKPGSAQQRTRGRRTVLALTQRAELWL